MEDTNITNEPKKKKWKKVVLYVLVAVAVAGIAVGGYFLYKHLFPTNKELFIIACDNAIEDAEEKQEAEHFQNVTSISFDTDGDFTNPKASDALKTATISVETVKASNEKKEYNIAVGLLENELLSSQYVKDGKTESLYIPQLAVECYSADSYLDVLSLLLGSAESSDVDITQGVDNERFKKYYHIYKKMFFENVPDSDFTSVEKSNIRTITLKTDLNRAAYNVLSEMKNDGELCNFLYEQTKIITSNIENKHPYLSMFISAPQKNEFKEGYKTTIDDTIKSIENAEITVTIDVNENRRIEKTQLKIVNNGKETFSLLKSSKQFDITVNSEDKLLFKLQSVTESNDTKTESNTTVSFDVNDLTKDQTETPKIVSININSKTDLNVTKEISIPENCVDIRKISDEEKGKITEQASENFVALLTGLVTKLFT